LIDDLRKVCLSFLELLQFEHHSLILELNFLLASNRIGLLHHHLFCFGLEGINLSAEQVDGLVEFLINVFNLVLNLFLLLELKFSLTYFLCELGKLTIGNNFDSLCQLFVVEFLSCFLNYKFFGLFFSELDILVASY